MGSQRPTPIPEYQVSDLAMNFVDLPEVKLPETGQVFGHAMVIVCGLILEVPRCKQGSDWKQPVRSLLNLCTFLMRLPTEMMCDNASILNGDSNLFAN